MDFLALNVVEASDRAEFLALAVDLMIASKSPREERACVVLCRSKREPGRPLPCLLTLRLWTDTGTQSFVFAMQTVRLPKSKYLNPDLKRPRECLPLVVESTQRIVEKRKMNTDPRYELLTEEQLVASMLPLDEVSQSLRSHFFSRANSKFDFLP